MKLWRKNATVLCNNVETCHVKMLTCLETVWYLHVITWNLSHTMWNFHKIMWLFLIKTWNFHEILWQFYVKIHVKNLKMISKKTWNFHVTMWFWSPFFLVCQQYTSVLRLKTMSSPFAIERRKLHNVAWKRESRSSSGRKTHPWTPLLPPILDPRSISA